MKIIILYTDTTRNIEPHKMIFIHKKWNISKLNDDLDRFYKNVECGFIVNIAITRV